MDQQIGSYSRVLMEGTLNGHCEYFSNVRLYDEVEPGTIQKIKKSAKTRLAGEVVFFLPPASYFS